MAKDSTAEEILEDENKDSLENLLNGNQEKIREQLENIQKKVIQEKKPLNKFELKFLDNTIGRQDPQTAFYFKLLDKENRGEDLEPGEENFLEQIDLHQNRNNFSGERDIERFRFERSKSKQADKGGKVLLHFTDTHMELPDFEASLYRLLEGKQKPGLEEIVLHTGDMITDLIDTQNNGLEAFLPKTIISKGKLEAEDAKEFEAEYSALLKEAGISEEDLLRGTAGEQLNEFMMQLYGYSEPNFKTKEELEQFKKRRDKVQKLMRKAIENHARGQYEGAKKILQKYGLTPENFALIEGNHDVPQVMREVLGEYMLSPGQTRNIKGVEFGQVISGSSGSFMGNDFADMFGYTDIKERLPQIKYELEDFTDLKSKLKSHGFDFSDAHLDRLISNSVRKARIGLGSKKLLEFDDNIQEQLNKKIEEELSRLPNQLPKADIYLGHGDPTDPRYAGLEEAEVHRLLRKQGGTYIHGHIHQNTTHRQDGVTYLNPGSGMQGYGKYVVNKNNKLIGTFFEKPNMEGDLVPQYLAGYEIPGRKSQEYSGGGKG